MKKTYKLICIRRDKKWEGDICTYTITPVSKGLKAIQDHLSQNNFDECVEFLAKEVESENAIFTLRGRKKNIQKAVHTLLCDTNIPDHFKVEEEGY